MDESLYRALGVMFWMFMSGAVVATAIWAVKKFLPAWTHSWLLEPLTVVTRRLVNRVLPGLWPAPRRGQAGPAQSGQYPAARD